MRALATKPAANDEILVRPDDKMITLADPKVLMMLITRGVLGAGMSYLQHVSGRSLNPPINIAPPEPSDIMTADEVAAYLGVDRNTIYEYAARGTIPHKRLGKRVIFRRGAIVAWLDSKIAVGDR